MFPCLAFGYGYWWIFPIIMIAMMGLCFFMMRGHAGSMMCGQVSADRAATAKVHPIVHLDILNRKNDQEETNKQEDEEKNKDITGRT